MISLPGSAQKSARRRWFAGAAALAALALAAAGCSSSSPSSSSSASSTAQAGHKGGTFTILANSAFGVADPGGSSQAA